MTSRWSRRSLLRCGGATGASLVAGCLGGGGGTPTEPSTGTYGLTFRNRAAKPMMVTAEVKKSDADEPFWTKELTLEGKATERFDAVITDAVEQVVIAKLPDVTPTAQVEPYHTQSNFWITPGSDDAPTVEDLKVITNVVDNQYSPKLRYVVGVTHEDSSETPWAGV